MLLKDLKNIQRRVIEFSVLKYRLNKNNLVDQTQTLFPILKNFFINQQQKQAMSSFPKISQQQRNQNIKKLINQNKKLREQIFVFEEQINNILSSQQGQQKNKLSDSQQTKTLQLLSKSSSPQTQKFPNQVKQKLISSQIQLKADYIESLLEANSSLIESKIIPALKQQREQLKSQNVKDNAHYILKEEDQLKILKKELNSFRKQKQVITSFIKDKLTKLQKHNNQLQTHKNSLKLQLSSTIKFNRQSSTQLTQLERQIRKYHLVLSQFKKLSSSTLKGNHKESALKLKSNPALSLNQTENQVNKLKEELSQIQNIWKHQLDSLDNEYYQLKQQMQKKQIQEKDLQNIQTFHSTRVLAMKDEKQILSDKETQKLAKVNPKLQKQLQEYLKQEQEKLRKKQQLLKRHLPRDKDEDILQQIAQSNLTKSPNPQNETLLDDKNIIKVKNYLRRKQKVDKHTQAHIHKPINLQQNHRLRRSWSNIDQQGQQILPNIQSIKQEKIKQIAKRQLLLKNIKLGTPYRNNF